MIEVDLVQGTDAWHQFRSEHRTASEAPMMMGVSNYKSRDRFLREKFLGVSENTDHLKRIFEAGHSAEAAALPIAEKIAETSFQPRVGKHDTLPLSASFDGINFDNTILWEHKLWNEKIVEAVQGGSVPESHKPQLDQQLLVSGAEKVLFMVSDGTEDNMVYVWHHRDEERLHSIIEGWERFEKDLKSYQLPESDPEWDDLEQSYVSISSEIETLEAQLKEVKERLIALCGGESKTGRRVVVSKIVRAGSLDIQKIVRDYRVIEENYRKPESVSMRINIRKEEK